MIQRALPLFLDVLFSPIAVLRRILCRSLDIEHIEDLLIKEAKKQCKVLIREGGQAHLDLVPFELLEEVLEDLGYEMTKEKDLDFFKVFSFECLNKPAISVTYEWQSCSCVISTFTD